MCFTLETSVVFVYAKRFPLVNVTLLTVLNVFGTLMFKFIFPDFIV